MKKAHLTCDNLYGYMEWYQACPHCGFLNKDSQEVSDTVQACEECGAEYLVDNPQYEYQND